MEAVKWKKHPRFTDLRILEDGSRFVWMDKPIKIKMHKTKKGSLKVVMINRTYYSAAKLVLETWGEKPKDNKRYYACYKDGNKKNLHPDNLYWGLQNMKKSDFFERNIRLSKLTKDQTYEAYHRNSYNGESLASIARDFKVSDMTVHRAIKRLRKKVLEEKKN
ncbi:MAG: hypothetical protein WBL21_09535 [Salinimicrobium sp.]